MNPEDFENMSTRQIIVEINRHRREQDKRRSLLRDSARLADQARETGMSQRELRGLLSDNFNSNKLTLERLIEYSNSTRFAERQREERAKASNIKWRNLPSVSPASRVPRQAKR